MPCAAGFEGRLPLAQAQRDLARPQAGPAPPRAARATAAGPSGPRRARTPRAGRRRPAGRSPWRRAAGPRPPRSGARRSGSGGTRPCSPRRSTWLTACTKVDAGSVTPAAAGSARRGKSSTAKGRTVNDDRSDVMSTVSPLASTVTAPGARVRTASDVSRPGTTHGTVLLAVDLDRLLDRQLQVGPGDLQPGALEHEAHAGQDRLGPRPPLRGPRRGGQGLPEHVAFAAEPHRIPSLPAVTIDVSLEPSGSSKRWGLCTSRHRPSVMARSCVPRPSWSSTGASPSTGRPVDDEPAVPSSCRGRPQPRPQADRAARRRAPIGDLRRCGRTRPRS